MKTVIEVAVAVTHSLMFFYTASRGIPSFPEFVTVGMVNEQPISDYDSNIRREIPKQDWMTWTEKTENREKQTQISIITEQQFKAIIDIVRQRLNTTDGAHIVQNLYGCTWDEETGDVQGFNQFGYNGEDYIVLNLETQTWIATKQQAVITKMKWDRDQTKIRADKEYLTHDCVEWLKKHIYDGRSTLSKELPSIYLLQKTSTSPVTCHATGFYPDRAMLFWAKDGEEVREGVDPGEILPNHDGTFQMSVELDVSSVRAEDWGKYSCVFQLSGVKEDIFTKLDKAVIRTNEKSNSPLIIIAALAAVCLLVVALLGFFVFKKRNAKRPSSLTAVNEPGVEEELNPK